MLGYFVLALTWDLWWESKLQVLATATLGLLTIIGGFLLAYWLIESNRFDRELERKKRVASMLKVVRNFLLPWMYHHAIAISGHAELQDDEVDNKIHERNFKNDIDLLECIFGISRNYPDPDETISKHTFHSKTIRDSLNYGLRELTEIEMRIRGFPSFLDEVDPKIAKIMNLSSYIRERLTELDEWESKYGEKLDYEINFSMPNVAIRGNLIAVGRTALDVVIAVDANLDKLEAEL